MGGHDWITELAQAVNVSAHRAGGHAQPVREFTPDEAESSQVLLGRFDSLSERYLAAIGAMDPDAMFESGPAPWDDVLESVPVRTRFQLVHHVEEFARHAGHADIIREELDGAQAMGLKFALEGREGNDFVQPWHPEAATG